MNPFSIARMMFSAIIKPKQRIVIQAIPTGRLIDIGGGGEGVIAQVGGAAVVAMDRYLSEIDEARDKAPHAAWLVADAAGMPCESHCFDHATAFFSCMYMPDEVKAKVFRETWRVLKENGEFWIWDVPMTPKSKVFAIRLQVEIPGQRTINTTYGVKAKDQSAAGFGSLLQGAGFEAQIIMDQKHWFLIKAKKV